MFFIQAPLLLDCAKNRLFYYILFWIFRNVNLYEEMKKRRASQRFF